MLNNIKITFVAAILLKQNYLIIMIALKNSFNEISIYLQFLFTNLYEVQNKFEL